MSLISVLPLATDILSLAVSDYNYFMSSVPTKVWWRSGTGSRLVLFNMEVEIAGLLNAVVLKEPSGLR